MNQTMHKRSLPIIVAAMVLSACGDGAINIGAKSFAEQRILAEALKLHLTKAGYEVGPVVECGDTYGCQRMMGEGRVDVMVDYTGTGLRFAGAPIRSQGDVVAELNRLYERRGIAWVAPLGFENSYRILVTEELAAEHSLVSVQDLSRLTSGVRIATPAEYLRRPGDGLSPMLRHYGLKMAGEPTVVDDTSKRMRLLLDGRVDVAIGYSTDGALDGLGLVDLSDDRGFFPRYDAVIIARRRALKQHPDLEAQLEVLKSRLSDAEMRKINYLVDAEGRAPLDAATQLLVAEGLYEPGDTAAATTSSLAVAVAPADGFGPLAQRTALAVRAAFPRRAVSLKETRDPIDAVTSGNARLALVGAERFFSRRLGKVRREKRIEAVAVVGSRLVHVVRKKGAAGSGLEGRVGLEPNGSSAHRVGRTLLDVHGLGREVTTAEPRTLLASVEKGDIDVAVILCELGCAAVTDALTRGDLQLTSVGAPSVEATVFLHAARIPDGSYPGQTTVVDTISSQVVLAGPAPPAVSGQTAGGPASALVSVGLPLKREEVEALAAETAAGEAPDPALPSAWTSRDVAPAVDEGTEISDTLLNVATLAFMGWTGWLAFRRRSS